MEARAAARPGDTLLDALTDLRPLLDGLELPLETPAAPAARLARREVLDQLDDYVLPRLRDLDAPLLVVVGGSTGAGKSTLVNSLVGAQVSAPGVLRPTTRSPVLAHAPEDRDSFTGDRVLPGFARETRATSDAPGTGGSTSTLALVASDRVPPGLALLDAPDIDSVVAENRELAGQLLAAADLWVFVTTAARYADAVPWDLLRAASARSAAVAVVLDRVPPGAEHEIEPHLRSMLAQQGLSDSPVFVVPESALSGGLLPEQTTAALRSWLSGLAADAGARAGLVRRTLDGVLAGYTVRLPALANALEEQDDARADLATAAARAYAAAGARVDRALDDGQLLRGEVLARWQEIVGTGELLRQLESRVGRLRDRLVSAVRGRPSPDQRLSVALESGLEALVRGAADAAAEQTVDAWTADPGGRALLGDDAGALARSSAALPEASARAVRDWQGSVLELVRSEGSQRRSAARVLSYGVNGAALVVMVAVFASTGGLTGGEVLVAGGASAVGQKLLEALLGDEAVRRLAALARADLRSRIEAVLAEERARFDARLERLPRGTGADDLRSAAARLTVLHGRAGR
ncbi:dynamin family protein [Motilibacter peucedani]|uniref:Dynamin family protein n=1 Tax=Motilibacter peucedani TaxID=598650 RepID=A0A420XTC2_9ACTN|nr:dynamin family protein [Motilibacter peucedani]RKS80085.1 dynamin family protein [Motilibacter peucedani]